MAPAGHSKHKQQPDKKDPSQPGIGNIIQAINYFGNLNVIMAKAANGVNMAIRPQKSQAKYSLSKFFQSKSADVSLFDVAR